MHVAAAHPLAAAILPRRDTIFKRREEILKSKDRELQESLIKFNKFLQDNDSKRNRAEKKVTTTHPPTDLRPPTQCLQPPRPLSIHSAIGHIPHPPRCCCTCPRSLQSS
jgi:hypothetical protein